jgi:hypothetical protein
MGTTNLVATSFTAVATFAATNIDDIVRLMLWFSQTGPALRGRQIVAGQYLGFVALVALSLLGFLGALIIPPAWIGLLGLAPLGGLWPPGWTGENLARPPLRVAELLGEPGAAGQAPQEPGA